jgi:gliding motility-associated-like protein
MRLTLYKLFSLLLFAAFASQGFAQTCSGSLGDPIINQTFGAGANPGPPLGSGVTNLNYISNNCPDDGYYTIANSLAGPGNCHLDTWHSVTTDHTGNPNGYMMIINASLLPSVFFTQQANGLCPNTTYEFSAYVLNLITLAASRDLSNGTVSEPDITFSIQTTDGKPLATYNTGTIPPTNDPEWNKFGVYFTTPADVTDVVVVMTNNAPGGNGNDLILDDIAFRACGPIIQTVFGGTSTNEPQNICAGNSASYTLNASVGEGYTNPFVQWQTSYNNGDWTNIAGATTTTLNVDFNKNSAIGVYQYRLAAGEQQNIASPTCSVFSSSLIVNVNALPIASAPVSQGVCEGNTLTLTATGGINYTWTGPNLSPTQQNPLVINNVTQANAGTYTVVASSAQGCPGAPVQTNVIVKPKITAGVNSDATICAGESTQLLASGGTIYKWTPSTGLDHDDVANPVASPLQTTTYHVDVSNGDCDDDSKSVTVTVNQNPIAVAGPDKVIFEGQSVKLNGSETGDNISSILWTPATGLDDPTSLTPVANPTDDITYTLNVVSQTCGSSTSSVFVRVFRKITIPNTFTPNNDGVNDYWKIDALVTYPESLVTVYSRYGQKVYQSIGYPKSWDGKYNGTPLPDGTYYYIIDLKNNTPDLTGWVLIVR